MLLSKCVRLIFNAALVWNAKQSPWFVWLCFLKSAAATVIRYSFITKFLWVVSSDWCTGGCVVVPTVRTDFKGHRHYFAPSFHSRFISKRWPHAFRPDFEPDLVVWLGRIQLFCPNVQACGVKTVILLLLIESQPHWSWIVNISIYDPTSDCSQGKSRNSHWERADQEGSAARCTPDLPLQLQDKTKKVCQGRQTKQLIQPIEI